MIIPPELDAKEVQEVVMLSTMPAINVARFIIIPPFALKEQVKMF